MIIASARGATKGGFIMSQKRKYTPPPPVEFRQLTRTEIETGIKKLSRRIEELKGLNPELVRFNDSKVDTIESNIHRTILEIFGENSPEYCEHKFHQIWHGGINIMDSREDRQEKFAAGIPQTLGVLEGLIYRLKEQLEFLPPLDEKTPIPGSSQEKGSCMEWDIFICHASDDKEAFVRPLAEALKKVGLRVWYDEFSLKLGDSLRRSIDNGLKESRFGVVVLSSSFFDKHWPRVELDGLAQKEVDGQKVILPIWHNVNREDVVQFSPTLADRVAVISDLGTEAVVNEIVRAIRETGPEPQEISLYTHRIPVNYQGQLAACLGHKIKIKRWLGPDGPGGSGKLRVCLMTDLNERNEYTSDIAHVIMTIVPVDIVIEGRIDAPIERSFNSINFFLEMTEEEFAKFDANRTVKRSPLME